MTNYLLIEQTIYAPPDAYTEHRTRIYAQELLVEVLRLQKMNDGLVRRCAAAAEVLSKIANREKLTCPQCQMEWTLSNDKGTLPVVQTTDP